MHHTILLFGLGGLEIILIALVVLVLFGANRIPKLMKGFGKGMRDMKNEYGGLTDGFDDIKSEITDAVEEEPKNTRQKRKKK